MWAAGSWLGDLGVWDPQGRAGSHSPKAIPSSGPSLLSDFCSTEVLTSSQDKNQNKLTLFALGHVDSSNSSMGTVVARQGSQSRLQQVRHMAFGMWLAGLQSRPPRMRQASTEGAGKVWPPPGSRLLATWPRSTFLIATLG